MANPHDETIRQQTETVCEMLNSMGMSDRDRLAAAVITNSVCDLFKQSTDRLLALKKIDDRGRIFRAVVALLAKSTLLSDEYHEMGR